MTHVDVTPTSNPTSSEIPAMSFDELIKILGDIESVGGVGDETLSSQNVSESSFSSSLSVNFYEWLDEIYDERDREPDRSFTNPYSTRTRAVFIALYGSIFLLSMVGNSLVCLVVARNKRMRGVTNFFLANQACSDMLMTALNIPFIVYTQLTYDWPFGTVMCHLTDYLAVASVYVSCYTFTAIALDRHRVIVYPLRPRISMATAVTIAVGIWVLAVALPLPFAVFRTVIVVDTRLNNNFEMCVGNYPSADFGKYLVLVTFANQFAIPLHVNVLAYLHIGATLWKATYVGSVTARQQQANIQAKTRTTLMLVLVVAAFAICWFPLNIYLLVSHFHPSAKNTLAYLWCHFIAMSSVCINPVAFGFLNENFRAELRQSLICCVKRVTLSRNGQVQNGIRTRNSRASWRSSQQNSQVVGTTHSAAGCSQTKFSTEVLPMETRKPRGTNIHYKAISKEEPITEENDDDIAKQNISGDNDSGVA